ncbi:MAG: hypothetical protein NC452_13200 [Eubacterium sp.]|nr:hypothetical protein [Eubacterium sp.]
MCRYYSTQRPIGPGTIPADPKPAKVENFVARTFIESVGRQAWGYAEYPCELPAEEIAKWELTPEKSYKTEPRYCLVALAAMEAYRLKSGYKDPPDYAIRVCESILAEALGFNNRNDWTGKIQQDGLLEYACDEATRKQQYKILLEQIKNEVN